MEIEPIITLHNYSLLSSSPLNSALRSIRNVVFNVIAVAAAALFCGVARYEPYAVAINYVMRAKK
jgi:hypothetical protein